MLEAGYGKIQPTPCPLIKWLLQRKSNSKWLLQVCFESALFLCSFQIHSQSHQKMPAKLNTVGLLRRGSSDGLNRLASDNGSCAHCDNGGGCIGGTRVVHGTEVIEGNSESKNHDKGTDQAGDKNDDANGVCHLAASSLELSTRTKVLEGLQVLGEVTASPPCAPRSKTTRKRGGVGTACLVGARASRTLVRAPIYRNGVTCRRNPIVCRARSSNSTACWVSVALGNSTRRRSRAGRRCSAPSHTIASEGTESVVNAATLARR